MPAGADAPNTVFDVYLSCREFSSWGGPAFKQLPSVVKEAIVDIGICHYLVLVKSSDGRVLQLDFGPCGGDVHVSVPGTRLAKALTAAPARVLPTTPLDLEASSYPSPQDTPESSPGVPGEVRERWLPELPSNTPLVHMGQTSLSLQQIREFSQRQPSYYLLHDNDCRHFANNLVHHMTGMHKATAVFLRQQYVHKVVRAPHPHPHRPVIEALQALTDVTNWGTIKQAANAAATALTPLFGMRLLGGFKAAPARLAAGLKASKVLTNIVRSKAGLAMAATVGWRVQGMAPAALAAASLTAGAHKPHLPWEEAVSSSKTAAATPVGSEDRTPSVSTHQLQTTSVKDRPAHGRAARVSQSMTAALATYASTVSSSQPLVQLLGHHVHRRRDSVLQAAASTVGRLQGAASRVALGIGGAGRATASTLMRVAGAGRSGPGGAGALVLRKPVAMQPAALGMVSVSPAAPRQQQTAAFASAAPAWAVAAQATPSAAAVSRRLVKAPSARFFTRGASSSSSFLLGPSECEVMSQAPKEKSRSARAAALAATAFTTALQQQAARWYL